MTEGTILAVDDNPDNLVLLSDIVSKAGYSVRGANSGSRALMMAEFEPPEIILLDIDMPGMNGYEVCRSLKGNQKLASLPVIFISALDDAANKVKGFEAGAVDYITKPFDEAEVLARVGTHLRISRLQREIEQRNAELAATNDELQRQQSKTDELFSAVSELLPGRLIADAYEIEGMIGSGGFGVVYRARQSTLDRAVALKVLRPTGDPRRFDLFKREALAACRVTHPNAVEVIDSGYSQGVAYLVMELLRGYTAQWLLEQHRKLALERALAIAIPVADALTFAHAAGVIHRDVKPGNIYLHQTASGEVVKVVDFGIAKLVDDVPQALLTGLTTAGEVFGTPEFMAPERLFGGAYDASSDIYSLGSTLYRFLTGSPIFAEQKDARLSEMIALHLNSAPRPLGEVVDVPEDLGALVMEMIATDPAERPITRDVTNRLREVQARVVA